MNRMKLLCGIVGVLFLFVSFGCYSVKYVDVYSDQKVPYQETQYRTEAQYLPPIIDREGVVVAFTPIWGAERPTIARVSEAIRLGFLSESKNSERAITFISEGEMIMLLKESALHDFGENVLWRLQDNLTMNVLGTGTIMLDASLDKRLSMQAFDLQANETYDKIYFASSWEDVGIQIAKDFYGTTQVFRQVPFQAQKFRTETVVSGQKKVKVPNTKCQKALLIGLTVVAGVFLTLILVMET